MEVQLEGMGWIKQLSKQPGEALRPLRHFPLSLGVLGSSDTFLNFFLS